MAHLKYALLGFAAFAALTFSSSARAEKSPFTGADFKLSPLLVGQAPNPEGDEAAEAMRVCMTQANFDAQYKAGHFKLVDHSTVNDSVTWEAFQDRAGVYYEYTVDTSVGAIGEPVCQIGGPPSKDYIADQPAPAEMPVLTKAKVDTDTRMFNIVITPATDLVPVSGAPAPAVQKSPLISLWDVQDVPGTQTDQLTKVDLDPPGNQQ